MNPCDLSEAPQGSPPAPASTGPLQALPPAQLGRDQVVATALDDLADQIRHAARSLRDPDQPTAGIARLPRSQCDPQSIVDLVMDDLSRRGVKTALEAEIDLESAARSAALLLEALGVNPA
jgi:hypothetical protein